MTTITKFPMMHMDELRIRILVDNSIQGGDQRLKAVHGLSTLVQSRHEGEWTSVLFDVGADATVLLTNMEVMGIDPSTIDCIVLSHNHSDHTGGLLDVIERIGKPELPVVAHPAFSRVTFKCRPRLQGGIPKDVRKEEIEAAGGSLLAVSEPLEIAPGLFTSGYVERVTGEPTGLITKVLEPDGSWREDDVADDLSLLARVKGYGLVVITGCSHAGIVNIIRHSLKITGDPAPKALIGGFHLKAADEERIAWTVSELKNANIELIASGHCTGFDAEAELRKAFGKKYEHISVGKQFVFPK